MLQSKEIELLKSNIRKQKLALTQLEKSVDTTIIKAVNLLYSNKGRIIITGIGKSGYIGLKLTATLSSTGSPSQYINCAEANHGDLGAIKRNDILLALSKSGETKEMFPIIDFAKRNKIKLISITAKKNSFLAKNSDIICLIPDIPESCPLNLAPTTSTTMMLVLGDAINKNILIGIVTDGDLRRNISKNFLDSPIEKIMTKKPITVDSKMNIKDAINIMNSNKITAVFVVKKNSKVPEGILHIHDCIKIG